MSDKQLYAMAKLFEIGNLDPLLHSTQKNMKTAWQASGSDEYLIFSSRQLGKTHLGLCLAIETCIKQPGSRVLYYGPVRDKLKDIINDGLAPIIQFAPLGLIKRHKTEYRWSIGESELRLCALERAHIDSYRGQNAKGLIVIEEACFVDGEAWNYAWGSVIDAQRLRHTPKVLINTTPSSDEDHPIHNDVLARLEAVNAVARYQIYDNPFLAPEAIEKIRGRVTEEVWRREYLAEIFRSTVDVAVPEFDNRHIQKLTPPPFANWLTSIDFGGSMDPHGILLSYWDYVNKRWCIFKERLVPVNSSISEVIAAAKELEVEVTKGQHSRVIDCAGQVSIELAQHKFDHFLPTKGPGSFDASLQALRVGFQNDEIVIDLGCISTISQLKSGKLNKQRNDFHRNGSHHCDLIASALYGFKHIQTTDPYPANFGRPIAQWHTPPKPKSKLLALGHTF